MNAFAQIACVAVGGGAGAVARMLCVGAVARGVGPALAPLGVVAVNILGSLAMGVVAFWVLRRAPEAQILVRTLIMTGFLGGFTTFSTFALDLVGLIDEGRLGFAAGYLVSSVAGAILAFALGWSVARSVLGAL
ncbi:MAG: CrcB family protein [Pseudomonadota bacterium]